MVVVERLIQRIRPGKWEELEQVDKAWTAIERRLGFPPKARYSYVSKGRQANVLIIERQWDSSAAAEAAIELLQTDPEAQVLVERTRRLVESTEREFLWKLE